MKFDKKTKILCGTTSIIFIIAVTIITIAICQNNGAKIENKSVERENNAAKRSDKSVLREGILISGGNNENGSLSSVELFIPETNQICSLPPMTRSRYLHSQNQFLACGGGGRSSGSSCEEFNTKLGQWSLHPSPLIQSRRRHSSWTLGNGSVILLGGMHSLRENITELVSPGLRSVRALELNESMF